MARKVNIRGGKVLVLGGVVPVTEDRCCCPCPLICVTAELTLHAAPNIQYLTTGLQLSASDTCTVPTDPDQERCVYSGIAACMASHTAVLTRYCNDDWILVIDGTASTPKNAALPYGAYTFPAGSNIAATISARNTDACDSALPYACVQYQHGTWDVMRLCVRSCMLPENWQNGWTEGGYDSQTGIWDADLWSCNVVTFLTACTSCVWDISFDPDELCYVIYKDGVLQSPAPGTLDHIMTWPQAYSSANGYFGHMAMVWGTLPITHLDTAQSLAVDFDGNWWWYFFNLTMYGKLMATIGQTGPYGTYSLDYIDPMDKQTHNWTAIISACP